MEGPLQEPQLIIFHPTVGLPNIIESRRRDKRSARTRYLTASCVRSHAFPRQQEVETAPR